VRIRLPDFDSQRVAVISRALVESSLRMRSMAFLSQVKMSLLVDTIHENDEPLDYMRQIRNSVVVESDDWMDLPVKISEEARELQQMTLTMERRRDELRVFLADQMRNLRRSETRFHQLFELIPDAVGIHQNGLWLFVNPAMVSIFSAESQEYMVGTPILDRVHPEDREKARWRVHRVMTEGKAAPLIVERLLRFDGSEFYGEVQGIPFSQVGKEAVVMTVMRDVTERMQVEAKSRQLTAAVEHTAEVIMISDAHACIEYVNPAFEMMTGYSSLEVVGEFASILRCDCHDSAFFRKIDAVVKSGNIWTGEVIIKDRHGNLITTDRSVSPVISSDGTVLNYITVMRDVTKEKNMQAKMEHTQRLESLGVLAGGIAHDFNNILTVIMGNAALGRCELEDTAPALMHLARIEESSKRAAELCKQMLAYSGKGKFLVKAVSLSLMVEGIVKLLEVSVSKNVVLKLHLAEALPAVDADVAQLQQIIMNLVINASDAINKKSGVVSLSTGMMHADAKYLEGAFVADDISPGEFVFLEVADTGCGMDEATQKRVFDPFFTTKFTGRGLGMSAVLGIARGHHGAIKMYSEVGQGTTFKLLLPVSEAQVSDVEESESLGDWCGAGTILIVDDEESIREMAGMMLRRMGFDTLTAENGEHGLEVYRQHQSEIIAVLLDMTMPKLDGKGCFRELRRINKDVRVILSSGYNEEDATSRFAGQGLSGFIQKPYSPKDLREKIQAIFHT